MFTIKTRDFSPFLKAVYAQHDGSKPGVCNLWF